MASTVRQKILPNTHSPNTRETKMKGITMRQLARSAMLRLATKKFRTGRHTSPSNGVNNASITVRTNDNEKQQRGCFDKNAGHAAVLVKRRLSCAVHA